ncbi:hypothetical protein SNEBB_002693 [Seison nebaliae]|nr:hypothetical protein SNEBB_002693 [Seison nebaliae]
MVENMGIQASWHKDDILKLESKLGVIVMGTTPSILIIDNVHHTIYSLNRNISTEDIEDISKKYENYNLIVEQKLSNKNDIAAQILRLKKYIEMNEDETQSKKIFLKNNHFSEIVSN